MKRILIIGCGGAGKTTLARQLGEKLDLPVVHLDRIFWSPGNWQHMERAAFDAALERELAKESWIMDGNYDRTLPLRMQHCDAIIYLDFAMVRCMTGGLGRVIKNWGHARADMAPGCNEWFDPEMARFIWRYNRDNRQRNYRLLNEAEGVETIVLKNRRMVRRFLRSL